MKTKKLNFQTLSFLLLALSFILTTGMQCKKDQTSIDALPPATQEGKETFGCLVNGEAFTPKGSSLGGPILSSYYQYLNSQTAQGYYFNVLAKKKSSGNVNESVSLDFISKNIHLEDGKIYKLRKIDANDVAEAGYLLSNVSNSNSYKTQISIYIGELIISHLDETNQIVSGTFWFDAVNDKGEKVEVREGRFDLKYVK
jgi:hypothetical protein